MDNLQALYLGIVQGITEFLPISSSAHLILTSKIFNWNDQGVIFDLAVHVGSLIAVIIYFNKEVLKIMKGKLDLLKFKKTNEADLVKKLFVATIPVIIFGLLIKDLVENNFRENIAIIGIMSIFWGILLFFADKKEEKITSSNSISYKASILMGLAQAVAVIPGTSRSGSTMTIARFLNISRKISAEFSMLMSIPVIILMTIYKTIEIYYSNQAVNIDYMFLGTGIISSFIFAILSIHLLMKLITKVGFMPFVVYRILLGLAIFYVLI